MILNITALKKLKETYKLDVMFQTDFLEEKLIKISCIMETSIKTMQKLSKWHYGYLIIIMKHQLTGTMLYLVLTNNLQSLLILHSNKMVMKYIGKLSTSYTSSGLGHSKNSIISSLLIIKDQINIFNG
jgi:hypothetical protein